MPSPDYVPYYQEIINDLRAQIADGRLQSGERLPSTNALAKQYGRAPGTVREAVGRLIDEGVLRGHQGDGVFVVGLPTTPQEGSPG